jgi:hypothetical protein
MFKIDFSEKEGTALVIEIISERLGQKIEIVAKSSQKTSFEEKFQYNPR